MLPDYEITIYLGNSLQVYNNDNDFNDKREIVVRKTGFVSGRTLGINADRAASDVPEKMAKLLQNPQQKIQIQIAEQ